MKRIVIYLWVFISTVTVGKSQNNTRENQEKTFPARSVALMNPTVGNITTFRYLVDNHILPDADSLGMIGFYHAKQSYDFERSRKYIDEHNLPMKLIKCEGELKPGNLYASNDCDESFKDLLEQTGGVFFFGGPDIPGECFGEKTHLTTETSDPYRHFFELSFLFHLLGGNQNSGYTAMLEAKPDYVIVGFCLGMQTMNCATGGTMIQDIPMEVYHLATADDVLKKPNAQHKNYLSYFDYDNELISYKFHKIKPKGENVISELIGHSEPYILSSHHQAVKKIGKGLSVAATSPDGKIVEALVHKKYPHVVATQFHPEYTNLYVKEAAIRIDFQSPVQNYLSLYGGEKGENFHREYWKMIGGWLTDFNK
ncbi:MAG: gamma-glutamyl-gamma-aminobutyrate hydrolase family protein [Tannerella sp.]|jgi:putative glutamine amidotransferase|nr:gamma-glutamyl-gamma-aminobutyrate hydrolase family protein [Tannerella sp.]